MQILIYKLIFEQLRLITIIIITVDICIRKTKACKCNTVVFRPKIIVKLLHEGGHYTEEKPAKRKGEYMKSLFKKKASRRSRLNII